MVIKKHFDNAGITIDGGTLIINTVFVHMLAHYTNVDVTIDENNHTITVKANRRMFELNWTFADYDPKDVIESDTELYRPWPWSKPRLRVKQNCMIELRERPERTFKTNNYLIIE